MKLFIDSDTTFTTLSEFERRSIQLIEYSCTQKPTEPAPRIAQKILHDAHKWIDTASLYEASIQLLALALCNPSLISGSLFGQYANRLIRSEVKKGGPYRDADNTISIKTNIAIAQLFMQLNIPLVSLHHYLEVESKNSLQLGKNETRWIFLWPKHIISNKNMTHIKHSLMSFEIKIISLRPHYTTPSRLLPTSTSMTKAMQEINLLPSSMQRYAKQAIELVVSVDKRGEIQHLCTFFVTSLSVKNKTNIVDTQSLDLATIYAWVSYTLYDNCIDGDSSPDTIPVANFYHRKSLTNYLSFSDSAQNQAMVKNYFDATDYANAWEVTHCRMTTTSEYFTFSTLPNYQSKEILFHRASIHALGPLLVASDINLISKQQHRYLTSFFKHYIIARQINDDLHDWKNDIKNGHCSYVVAFILRKIRLQPGTHSFETVLPLIESYLWRSGFKQLLEIQSMHGEKAQKYLSKSAVLKNNSLFQSVTIDPIIASIAKAKQTLKDEKEFLNTFTY